MKIHYLADLHLKFGKLRKNYQAPADADLWIHGHLHSANDCVIGSTRVLSNCRGYADVSVDAAPGFRMDAVVGDLSFVSRSLWFQIEFNNDGYNAPPR